MTEDEAYRSQVPQERLTILADAAIEAVNEHGWHREDDRGVIMLSNASEERGGIGIFGYDDESGLEAATDLMQHLKGIFQANGITLQLLSDDGFTIL